MPVQNLGPLSRATNSAFAPGSYQSPVDMSVPVGEAQRNRIYRDAGNAVRSVDQGMASRGLYNSTVGQAHKQDIVRQQQQALGGLGSYLRGEQLNAHGIMSGQALGAQQQAAMDRTMGMDSANAQRIAQMIGLPMETLAFMERREDTYPSLDQLNRLAQILGQSDAANMLAGFGGGMPSPGGVQQNPGQTPMPNIPFPGGTGGGGGGTVGGGTGGGSTGGGSGGGGAGGGGGSGTIGGGSGGVVGGGTGGGSGSGVSGPVSNMIGWVGSNLAPGIGSLIGDWSGFQGRLGNISSQSSSAPVRDLAARLSSASGPGEAASILGQHIMEHGAEGAAGLLGQLTGRAVVDIAGVITDLAGQGGEALGQAIAELFKSRDGDSQGGDGAGGDSQTGDGAGGDSGNDGSGGGPDGDDDKGPVAPPTSPLPSGVSGGISPEDFMRYIGSGRWIHDGEAYRRALERGY